MAEDRGSKQDKARVERSAKTPSRVGSKTKGTPEELGPERRQELARQIEATRYRGKPPSI
jgi:hypothetical protein